MMEEYGKPTAAENVRRVKTQEAKNVDLVATALHLAEIEGRRLNAIINLCLEKAMARADKVDRMVKNGQALLLMAGIPVIIKDNIVYSGYPTTCGRTLGGRPIGLQIMARGER